MIAIKVHLRWIALAGMVFWTVPAAAQFPEKFTNLKVLPKDISRSELQSMMRGFAFALNVRCDHCHAEKVGGKKFDVRSADRRKQRIVLLQIDVSQIAGWRQLVALQTRLSVNSESGLQRVGAQGAGDAALALRVV